MKRPRKSHNYPDFEDDFEERYYTRQEELSEMDREETFTPCDSCPTPFKCSRLEICLQPQKL